MSVPLPASFGANVTIPLSAISTPLLFLSPHDAHMVSLATYFHIASTSVLVWDVLNNLRNDFKLLTNYKLGVPTLLYFMIRLSLLTYSLGRAILLTSPVKHCGGVAHALNIVLAICVASATTFFYLRVVAIYHTNRYIIGFFGIAWLAIAVIALLFTRTFSAVEISKTGYCLEIISGPYLLPIMALIWANDLLVYLAIVHRIYCIFSDYDFEASLQRRLVILLFGASLPVGSKIVLLESQLSCLIIVFTKSFLVVGLAIDEDIMTMFIICHLVLVAILASRMYRDFTGISGGSVRAPVTEFRTANLTTAEFRGGVAWTRAQEEEGRGTRALRASSSTRRSITRSNAPSGIASSRPDIPSVYGGSEMVNLDTFDQSALRNHPTSDIDIGGGLEAQASRP